MDFSFSVFPSRAFHPPALLCKLADCFESTTVADLEEAEKGDKPTVGLDYKSFGQSSTEDDKAIAIVMRDRITTCTYAHICERKGAGDRWVVGKIVEDIVALGYTEIILKGDGEPALNDVMEKVKLAREHSTILQNPPAYDPKATGLSRRRLMSTWVNCVHVNLGWERESGLRSRPSAQ